MKDNRLIIIHLNEHFENKSTKKISLNEMPVFLPESRLNESVSGFERVFNIPSDLNGKNSGRIFFSPLKGSFLFIENKYLNVFRLLDGTRNIGTLAREFRLAKNFAGILDSLSNAGFISLPGAKSDDMEVFRPGNMKIPSITILPTNNCNLGCKYCFSDGGRKKGVYLDREIAGRAIKTFIRNNFHRTNTIRMVFNGGGEPTFDTGLFEDIINLFNLECGSLFIKPEISLASNGVFKDKIRNLIVKHKISVQISIDGPGEIQNKQRPLKNGGESYDIVTQNISHLLANEIPVTLRVTVSSISIYTMERMVHFAAENGIKSIHFEPLYHTGLSIQNQLEPPGYNEYALELFRCFKIGAKLGIRVEGTEFERLSSPGEYFCGANGDGITITPDGYITCCIDVADFQDPASEIFFTGMVSEQKGFDFFESRVNVLKSRTGSSIKECSDCFLKYNCAGGCHIRAYRYNNNIFQPVSKWCSEQRNLIAVMMNWFIENKTTVWPQKKRIEIKIN